MRLGHDGAAIKASGGGEQSSHGRKSAGSRFSATVIRAALESAGVIFVDENGEGPGVRLRKGGLPGTKAASIPLEDLNAENDE
jgi:hypothetical protein